MTLATEETTKLKLHLKLADVYQQGLFQQMLKENLDICAEDQMKIGWIEKAELKDNPEESLPNDQALSFVNLVSSASLILPPEIDTVVIARDKFVVEWNERRFWDPILLLQLVHIFWDYQQDKRRKADNSFITN